MSLCLFVCRDVKVNTEIAHPSKLCSRKNLNLLALSPLLLALTKRSVACRSARQLFYSEECELSSVIDRVPNVSLTPC